MKLVAREEAETEEAGHDLGQRLKARKDGALVCLYGDLGTGKTVFTRGMARSMGIPARDITSVSFTIAAEHESTPPFCHIDLYRLHGGEDLEELGIYEYFGPPWITVVEWAEKLAHGDSDDAVHVRIRMVDENTREIIIEGADE